MRGDPNEEWPAEQFWGQSLNVKVTGAEMWKTCLADIFGNNASIHVKTNIMMTLIRDLSRPPGGYNPLVFMQHAPNMYTAKWVIGGGVNQDRTIKLSLS